MKTRLSFAIVLVVLCALLSTGAGSQARAQQEPDRGPGLDRLFDLTSYQGMEEMPYLGNNPAQNELYLLSPDVNVPWSQITFQSFRNVSDWNIFLADGSGGNQTQLTWDASADIQPRLNRGCTKIVFASNSTGNYEIYTMNPDSSGLARLTHDKKYDNVLPAWSYDGTLIAFQSYRDGNPEIYTMNPDGSNQVRLTSYGGYDGTPSWSADGRIVFASDRVGTGGIWVMNSDGSGATQLASETNSIFPAWSPDGSQIAYSADSNGNGFMELWLVNSDGANPHLVYDPGPSSHYWVRSWSPGGQYIAFTSVNLIFYQGDWYWTEARLFVWDTQVNSPSLIVNDNKEWYPDWQTIDTLLPVSTMSALAAISPASFTVSWSGYDEGPSGLKNFDVQVKDGAAGTWTNWVVATTSTSAIYTGVGGHTYYFRTRAHDIAENFEAWPLDYDAFTTVEALPPYTYAKPLPAYIHSGSLIQWGGSDPGGSGIKTYDVQYRDTAAGAWVDWLSGTQETDAYFGGTSGHTYQFRVRATDKAQNVEGWPSGDGDTSTTIYLWAIEGISWDNTGVPVAGLEISTLPGAHDPAPSDQDGNYAAHVVSSSNHYTATWNKAGYGELPATAYGNAPDAEVDLVMPPADNIVQDGGFEGGSFNTAWQPTGGIAPTLSEEQHTGQYSVQLGQAFNFLPAEPMTLTNMSDSRSNMAVGSDGSVHIVWGETEGGSSHVFYAHRNKDGFWDLLRQEISGPGGGASPQIAVDDNLTAHVVWTTNEEIYYASKASGGAWSDPVNLTNNTEIDSEAQIRVGPGGVIHILWWRGDRSTMYSLGYAQKVSGMWSSATVIPVNEHLNEGRLHFIAGEDGTIYVQYSGTECHYTQRQPDGTWTSLEIFPKTQGCSMASDVLLAVDTNGGVHAVWLSYYGNSDYLYYAKRGGNGWAESEIISENEIGALALTIDTDEVPHVTWCQEDIYYYSRRRSENSWRVPEGIPGIACHFINWSRNIHLQFDAQKTLHLAWEFGGVHYMYRKAGEDWSIPWDYTYFSDTVFDLGIENDQSVHMLWNSPWQIFYAGPPSAEQTGEATISQAIHVPITLTTPALSFMYNLGGWSTSITWSGFSVQLTDGATTTELLSSHEATPSWKHAWFDLTPWLNQTITLTFQADQAAGYYPLWANLDEITIGSAHPDVWVNAHGAQAAMPGEPVALQLTYGNRSPAVEAISATITATLPTGLIFASASLTPTLNGNVLTWSVGDLPAGSGPFTILVTATVAGDATLGSYLTVVVEIAAATPELELVNNQREYVLFIGSRVYLPVTVR